MKAQRGKGCLMREEAFVFYVKVRDKVPCYSQHGPLVLLLLLLFHFERELLLPMMKLISQARFTSLAILSFKGSWPEVWCSDLKEGRS